MSLQIREGSPDLAPSASKRTWTKPKIEKVAARDAQGSVFSYGGPDAGIYS